MAVVLVSLSLWEGDGKGDKLCVGQLHVDDMICLEQVPMIVAKCIA